MCARVCMFMCGLCRVHVYLHLNMTCTCMVSTHSTPPPTLPTHPHTGCADGTTTLLSTDTTKLATLTGHTDRLARVAFHPMGNHLATAGYDGVWRLWDVATGTCLVEQEGHSRAVYAVAFHRDGSLAATGGLDSVGVWVGGEVVWGVWCVGGIGVLG